jgi:alkanesulfonate monooxygenase SsuD/methylene tetrahydromethanopterin reductase-like flavin-dependent oxidoreductase (luciferase family)
VTAPRLGLVLPELPTPPHQWRDLGSLAAAAEQAGADSIWLTDHLFWHRPTVDVLSALTLVAAATTRATIGPCILQLPLRDIAPVAKATAFLHALAPGRVVVGVGAGEHRGEYEAAGRGDAFGHRGALLDQGIEDLRTAWSADGRYAMDPPGPLPIWVGGRSDAARKRAATLADGWIPHLCRLHGFADQMAALDRDLDRAKRTNDPTFTRAAVVAVRVTDAEPGTSGRAWVDGDWQDDAVDADPLAWLGRLYDLAPSSFERVLLHGTAAQVADELSAMAEAGADELVLFPAGGDPVPQLTAVRTALPA